MSRRITIETNAAGKQQFVSIKRSRSDGHHHHHHHHDHDHDHRPSEYVKIKRQEWMRLVERERVLENVNKNLVCEVNALKHSLSTAQADAHHLAQVVIPQLECQIGNLTADNEALRRSLDSATAQLTASHKKNDQLQHRVDHLEKDNKSLRCQVEDLKLRIKHLSRQLNDSCSRRVSDLLRELEHLKERMCFWKDKYEDLFHRHNEQCHHLTTCTKKMHAYEEILMRRGYL